MGVVRGRQPGREGRESLQPQVAGGALPYPPPHARPPGELLPPPALCSHLLLERIWEVHGRFLTRVLPNGIAYRSCLGVRAERWSGLPARGWYLPIPPPPFLRVSLKSRWVPRSCLLLPVDLFNACACGLPIGKLPWLVRIAVGLCFRKQINKKT